MNRFTHPLLGRDSFLTGMAVALVGILSVGSVLQYLLAAHFFTDDRFLGATWIFDGFVALLIVGLGLSWVLAIVYGWANGGPLLAATLALLPTALGSVVRLDPTITADLVLAASVASVAVWFGAWAGFSPGDEDEGTEWVAVIGALVTGFAAGAFWRGTEGFGPHTDPAGTVALVLIGVGIVSGVIWTVAQLRPETWKTSL